MSPSVSGQMSGRAWVLNCSTHLGLVPARRRSGLLGSAQLLRESHPTLRPGLAKFPTQGGQAVGPGRRADVWQACGSGSLRSWRPGSSRLHDPSTDAGAVRTPLLGTDSAPFLGSQVLAPIVASIRGGPRERREHETHIQHKTPGQLIRFKSVCIFWGLKRQNLPATEKSVKRRANYLGPSVFEKQDGGHAKSRGAPTPIPGPHPPSWDSAANSDKSRPAVQVQVQRINRPSVRLATPRRLTS